MNASAQNKNALKTGSPVMIVAGSIRARSNKTVLTSNNSPCLPNDKLMGVCRYGEDEILFKATLHSIK